MKRVPHRDSLEASSGHAGELDRHGDSLGSPRSKETLVQVSRSEFGQLARKSNGIPVGITSRTERQVFQSLLNRLPNFRVTKPDLVHVVPVKIQVSASLGVDKKTAFAPVQHIEAWSGKGLMEKISRILFQERARFLVEVLSLPAFPERGHIHVTL